MYVYCDQSERNDLQPDERIACTGTELVNAAAEQNAAVRLVRRRRNVKGKQSPVDGTRTWWRYCWPSAAHAVSIERPTRCEDSLKFPAVITWKGKRRIASLSSPSDSVIGLSFATSDRPRPGFLNNGRNGPCLSTDECRECHDEWRRDVDSYLWSCQSASRPTSECISRATSSTDTSVSSPSRHGSRLSAGLALAVIGQCTGQTSFDAVGDLLQLVRKEAAESVTQPRWLCNNRNMCYLSYISSCCVSFEVLHNYHRS